LDDMTAGLMITIFGLLLAFTFMGIFIGTIVLLQKVFPARSEGAQETNSVSPAAPMGMAAEIGTQEEVVAAIAVALSALHSEQQSELGSALQCGRSTWWVSKRMVASQDVGWVKK
jgi:Na+-transporting methylmalonyl-CoA/oxaloacetate decarboxylase gamma subunit